MGKFRLNARVYVVYLRRRRSYRDRTNSVYFKRPGRTTCAYTYITYTHRRKKLRSAYARSNTRAHKYFQLHTKGHGLRVLPRALIFPVPSTARLRVYSTASQPPPPSSPSSLSCRHRRVYTTQYGRRVIDHAYPVDLYTPDWPAARTREQPPACSARAPPIISVCENPTHTT